MNKNIIPLVMSVVVVAGIGIVINAKMATPKQLETIKVGHLPLVGNWPFYVADNQKFFEKAGIKVEYTNFQSSNQVMDGLIRGDIQASYLGSLPVLAAQNTDPDKVKIFAFGDYNLENPFDALLVKIGSAITSVKDLAGKKIGVFPGTTSTNFVRAYLEQSGVDTKDIQFIQLPPPAQLQALTAGSIDALHAYELNVATALDQDVAVPLDKAIFAHVLDGAAIGVVAARTEWLEKNPKQAERLIKAFEKGLKQGQADPATTRSIVKQRLNLTDSVAAKVTLLDWVMAKDYDFKLFKRLATLSAEIGDLKSVPAVDNLKYQK